MKTLLISVPLIIYFLLQSCSSTVLRPRNSMGNFPVLLTPDESTDGRPCDVNGKLVPRRADCNVETE